MFDDDDKFLDILRRTLSVSSNRVLLNYLQDLDIAFGRDCDPIFDIIVSILSSKTDEYENIEICTKTHVDENTRGKINLARIPRTNQLVAHKGIKTQTITGKLEAKQFYLNFGQFVNLIFSQGFEIKSQNTEVFYIATKLQPFLSLDVILKHYQKNTECPIFISDVLRILVQTARAIEQLHNHDTIHLDIKPSNILISDELNSVLSDLAFCIKTGTNTQYIYAFGTKIYMAPELSETDIKIPNRVDNHSFTSTIVSVLTRINPFDTFKGDDVYTDNNPNITNFPYSLNQLPFWKSITQEIFNGWDKDLKEFKPTKILKLMAEKTDKVIDLVKKHKIDELKKFFDMEKNEDLDINIYPVDMPFFDDFCKYYSYNGDDKKFLYELCQYDLLFCQSIREWYYKEMNISLVKEYNSAQLTRRDETYRYDLYMGMKDSFVSINKCMKILDDVTLKLLYRGDREKKSVSPSYVDIAELIKLNSKINEQSKKIPQYKYTPIPTFSDPFTRLKTNYNCINELTIVACSVCEKIFRQGYEGVKDIMVVIESNVFHAGYYRVRKTAVSAQMYRTYWREKDLLNFMNQKGIYELYKVNKNGVTKIDGKMFCTFHLKWLDQVNIQNVSNYTIREVIPFDIVAKYGKHRVILFRQDDIIPATFVFKPTSKVVIQCNGKDCCWFEADGTLLKVVANWDATISVFKNTAKNINKSEKIELQPIVPAKLR